ncbi:MAG: hypothetical protein HC857_07350, partial [Synechococcales cyanobacterium RU_4_20]|nr:hypothetical protein [Synechococcales cyanobacterium RU_4_20]
MIGIPIFETNAAGCWEEIIDDSDRPSKLPLSEETRQVLGILLFALPQVRPQDRRLVDVISTVAAQFGTIVQQK